MEVVGSICRVIPCGRAVSVIAQIALVLTAKVPADLVASEFLTRFVCQTRHDPERRRRGYRKEAVQ